MNLAEHYNNLYSQSTTKIASGNYETDPLIDDPTDNRFGMTLVIRPDDKTKHSIQRFLAEVNAIEPEQYYYKNTDLHITVMSVISCYEGFDLNSINIQDYVEIIESILQKYRAFNIHFKGLTASPSCILIQGFLTETLNAIRDDLRLAFKNSELQQSIDKRYAIQTAHATIIRFRKKLVDEKALIELVSRYRNHDFGIFKVNRIELVYNDWYQREKFVKTLHKFDLRP